MRTNEPIKTKMKYVGINFILFFVLYASVSFNKAVIRPVFRNKPVLGLITGSFPNFMAAYMISPFPL